MGVTFLCKRTVCYVSLVYQLIINSVLNYIYVHLCMYISDLQHLMIIIIPRHWGRVGLVSAIQVYIVYCTYYNFNGE